VRRVARKAAAAPQEPDKPKIHRPADVYKALVSIDPSFARRDHLDPRLWEAWSLWFDHLFRQPISGQQDEVMFLQLSEGPFNNGQLHRACQWWAANGSRWPFYSDLLRWPELKED